MSSGVKVTQEVEQAFKQMQQRKEKPFLIFKLSEDLKEVVVDKEAEGLTGFDEFKKYMIDVSKAGQARYAVYDVYDEADKGPNRTGKLLFVLWSDDNIPIKQKMLYTSSLKSVKQSCPGYHKEMEIHDEGELCFEEFLKKVKGTA